MNTADTKSGENSSTSRLVTILANIVSYVCHPVFMPLIMAMVLTRLAPNSFAGVSDKQIGMWMLTIAFSGVFFPIISIALMKALGFIESFHMRTARERTIPLMATMIFYFWVSQVFNRMPDTSVPLIIKVLLLGNFWGIIVIFIVNIFTKVSMHTSAAGAMIGVIGVLMLSSPVSMLVPLFAAIIIAGVIGSARLVLGSHQPGDVWLGYIIGIVCASDYSLSL